MLNHTSRPSPLILLVCFPISIHAARWAGLLRKSPFRIVIFPSVLQDRCPELIGCPTISTRADAEALPAGSFGYYDGSLIESVANSREDQELGYCPMRSCVDVVSKYAPSPSSLAAAIRMLAPDMLHTLELQHATYLGLEARRRMKPSFPIWMASNWGSDLFLYHRIASHVPVLREVMQSLDALHSECARDNKTAVDLGFRGVHFPNVPASGGSDPKLFRETAALTPPSQRDLILIKGYHGWAGRGQHLVLAIHRIAPMLKRYRIRITHSDPATTEMVQAVAKEDGLDIAVDRYYPDHSAALERLKQARVVVGCGISDGISTTLLEAMMVGAFPIQSDTACACEWIESGVGGFILSPHDTSAFADAIAKAVTDDRLVDNAASLNRKVALKRWNTDEVAPVVVRGYQDILNGVRTSAD